MATRSGIDVIALAASVENEDTDGVTTATSSPQFDNDQEFTSISAALDLYVDVTPPTDELIAGSTDDVTFTITFGNRGPSTGTDVMLEVQLPDGVTRVERRNRSLALLHRSSTLASVACTAARLLVACTSTRSTKAKRSCLSCKCAPTPTPSLTAL